MPKVFPIVSINCVRRLSVYIEKDPYIAFLNDEVDYSIENDKDLGEWWDYEEDEKNEEGEE